MPRNRYEIAVNVSYDSVSFENCETGASNGFEILETAQQRFIPKALLYFTNNDFTPSKLLYSSSTFGRRFNRM